jgi:hypothetical protein
MDNQDQILLELQISSKDTHQPPLTCEFTASEHIKGLNYVEEKKVYAIYKGGGAHTNNCTRKDNYGYNDGTSAEGQNRDFQPSTTNQINMLQNSIENMHVAGKECNDVNEENQNSEQQCSVTDSCCTMSDKVVIHQQHLHATSDSMRYSQVESIYRLRMSSWCYSICDYIGASRHIVAVAFNYLDRFLEVEKYSW